MNTSRGSGEPLADLEATLIEVEQVPKVQKIERRFNRKGQVVVIVSLLIAIASALWNGFNTYQIAQNEAQNAITQKGVESLLAANEVLREKGLPEIPVPRTGDSINADALAAAAAAILYERIEDDPRFRGEEGDKGDQGDQGEPGEPCRPEILGCVGRDGQNGSKGDKGDPAPPVTDERIANQIELYCGRDPSPCRGPAGEQGVQGEPGVPGQMGPAGPYCPKGYTMNERQGPGLLPETWFVCTRN